MEFYDESNKKIIIPNQIFEKKINSGHCGSIYKYDETSCIKLYNQIFTESRNRLDLNLYHDVKDINSSNVIDIQKVLFYEEKKKHYTADAYISKYYKEKYDNILQVPTEYILENSEKIIKFSNMLSLKKIRFYDLKRDNLIFDHANIVFIDIDMWYYSYLDYMEISSLNINAISSLFNNIVSNTIKEDYQDLVKRNKQIYFAEKMANQLFPITSNPKKQIKTLTKKLSKYDKPIDYIMNRSK